MNCRTAVSLPLAFLTVALVSLSGTLGAIDDSKSAPPVPATRSDKATDVMAERPAMTDDVPRDYKGVHNVVAFYDGYWSGSVPEGDAGFDTLKSMGVKTIISVDGAEPDVDLAKARGIRYIHLPIGYNGFDEKRKLELVRATRDAMNDGPVYIHCHHGKHRSAGAAGAVAASLGWITPEKAVDRMKVSGTAPDYKGLYSCTANAAPLDSKTIDAVPADFPEVSHPASFVKSMVEIDEINDHLKAIEKAGWIAPTDHPDLVPVAEAGRLADLFRFVSQSEKALGHPADFAAALKLDGERLQALEEMLAAGEKDAKKLSDQYKLITTSCKDCHAKYRD
jgi:hypothetical protein